MSDDRESCRVGIAHQATRFGGKCPPYPSVQVKQVTPCHPERTREGSRDNEARSTPEILREYAQDDGRRVGNPRIVSGWVPPFVGAILFSLSLFPYFGCDYGVGGTGELVVSHDKLHDVGHLQLAPATQASTEPTTFPTTAPAASIELTIEQVRRDALANNLDLHAQLFDPTIASESLKAARAQFESVFTTDVNYSDADSPTATPGIAGTENRNFNLSPGLRIPLITGGQIDLNGPQSRNETNNPAVKLNDETASSTSIFYTSDVNATISIPLLRGFGVAANAQNIRLAFYESQAAQARTKLEVIQVLTDVEKTYWLLYARARAGSSQKGI